MVCIPNFINLWFLCESKTRDTAPTFCPFKWLLKRKNIFIKKTVLIQKSILLFLVLPLKDLKFIFVAKSKFSSGHWFFYLIFVLLCFVFFTVNFFSTCSSSALLPKLLKPLLVKHFDFVNHVATQSFFLEIIFSTGCI